MDCGWKKWGRMKTETYLRPMLSFWEKESFLQYDVVVVGGGIVGLSTACSIKERSPATSVLVLERGIFPTGASTKNAGFACYGSAAEIWHDVDQLGKERALEVVELRVKGLKKLRNRLGDEALGYEELGGGEIFKHGENFDLAFLPEINDWLRQFFGKDVFINDPNRIQSLGFQKDRISKYITNTVEGQLDTGKMMKNLLALCRHLGVEILTGAKAEKPERINGKWQIPIADSASFFEAEKVAICTNAFTPYFFPELDIEPGRGQVLITKPIENLQVKGIFHFEEGYFYFRNVGNRILFGGGRNMDFEGETTDEIALNQRIQSRLDHWLREMILPKGMQYEVEHRWAGIMAFGEEKVPIITELDNGLVLGVRMNGMGIAMGTEVGERLANMLV